MVDSEDDLTPEEALEKVRAAGFREGKMCRDVRAGAVELNTLSPDKVTFVSGRGPPLRMGTAIDLWESYQNGSIRPLDEDP